MLEIEPSNTNSNPNSNKMLPNTCKPALLLVALLAGAAVRLSHQQDQPPATKTNDTRAEPDEQAAEKGPNGRKVSSLVAFFEALPNQTEPAATLEPHAAPVDGAHPPEVKLEAQSEAQVHSVESHLRETLRQCSLAIEQLARMKQQQSERAEADGLRRQFEESQSKLEESNSKLAETKSKLEQIGRVMGEREAQLASCRQQFEAQLAQEKRDKVS